MATTVHPRAWLARRRARRDADQWIAHGFEARYPWRVAELTSARERRACARALRSVVDELTGAKLPGATPLRGAALRPHVAALESIERRLLDDRPVSASGVLAVDELLTSPGSCFFVDVDEIAACLESVLRKLEVRS
jgi:hypothetical protein